MISSIESTWEIIHIKNVTKNNGHRGFFNQAGKQTTLMKPLEANCGSNKQGMEIQTEKNNTKNKLIMTNKCSFEN